MGIAKKEKDSNASRITSGCVVLLGDGKHNNSYESGRVSENFTFLPIGVPRNNAGG